MGNYGNDRGNRYGGGGYRRDFGNRRDFGDRDRGPKEMFKTICDNCGKSCEVPFRPSGDKPVYCSDCFNQMNDRGGNDRYERRDFDRSERPERESRPVSSNKGDNGKIMEKLNELNTKFEKLLNVLEALTVEDDEDDDYEDESEVDESPVVEVPVKEKKTRAKKTKETPEVSAE